jgi:hypothetical protein
VAIVDIVKAALSRTEIVDLKDEDKEPFLMSDDNNMDPGEANSMASIPLDLA